MDDQTNRYPTPEEIRAARLRAGLTQTEAAELVHTVCRVWQQWEYGKRRMHPAFWALFRMAVELETMMDYREDNRNETP